MTWITPAQTTRVAEIHAEMNKINKEMKVIHTQADTDLKSLRDAHMVLRKELEDMKV